MTSLREEDQIVVICGRNTVLASKLRGEKWPVHVTIKVKSEFYKSTISSV
jgi:hypothetical protein